MVFDTDGSVIPCNSIIDVTLGKFGQDFSSSKELMALLNSNQLKTDYKSILRYPSSECTNCKFNDMCRGGCILNWLILDPKICRAVS
ncbi:MAG: SPASM domain-containing protein [Candidatus Nomurabacteria bacterium]|nr:SPASM domain-containing protein [Candidatus Nomurabacteria bacterium]